MSEILTNTPNTPSAAPVQNAVPSLDSIAQKMAAMRENLPRNPSEQSNATETGTSEKAKAEAPVAPEDDNDSSSVMPEVESSDKDVDSAQEDGDTPQEVSSQDSSKQDVIDFLEFAQENPNAQFKFMRNGKEMIIDAKRAAAILGQGGAIHEEARELKVQKAEFDEYLKDKRAEQEGLTLALEFTVRPQLQKAYDEIIKTQGYQQTFNQQLQNAQSQGDYAAVARIQANMAQNERHIQQQGQIVNQLKPNLEQFYDLRRQQVNEVLENNRKSFTDKELKNEYVYKEIRDKVSKNWAAAKSQLVPGIDNIDLISSDEHILSLVRDGLKYREKPTSKSAGSSIAALTQKRSSIGKSQGSANLEQLQQAAKGGDRKAQDNLLVAKLNAMRGRR
ncbi:hypothetical protein UFOVP94_42 [uncultured Caudovirales phage]|uniref:Uncharacterized protein n=3 Tax=uncultured Caudovirales phage TaxID=2100421 RepID=A0A6J5L6Z8_9CAUD|nr:hypothetical protein UFOVP94_42 [uncultured Caudovirales phage]